MATKFVLLYHDFNDVIENTEIIDTLDNHNYDMNCRRTGGKNGQPEF